MTFTSGTICAVILTLNEDSVLERSLSSVQWCDEVVVLDSGSQDLTHSIALSFGATLIEHVQPDPFLITKQRNYALTCPSIKSEWFLFLDADEEISPALAENIRHAISSSDNSITGFELAPRFLFLGKWLKHTQAYPCWHPRIARRGRQSFQGGVWESFSNDTGIERIHIPYEHYAFAKGLDDWIERHLRYAKWEAKCIREGRGQTGQRSTKLRSLSDLLWPLRPLTGFTNKYILCKGFLDGWYGFLFCCMMGMYDLFVVIYVLQQHRLQQGKSL